MRVPTTSVSVIQIVRWQLRAFAARRPPIAPRTFASRAASAPLMRTAAPAEAARRQLRAGNFAARSTTAMAQTTPASTTAIVQPPFHAARTRSCHAAGARRATMTCRPSTGPADLCAKSLCEGDAGVSGRRRRKAFQEPDFAAVLSNEPSRVPLRSERVRVRVEFRKGSRRRAG
jgi:hypothetical protein